MLRMTADSSNEFHADQRKVRSLFFVGKRKLEARSRTYEHCMIVIRARRLRPPFSTRVHIHNLPWFKKVLNLAESLIQVDTFEFLLPWMKVLDGHEYALCECTPGADWPVTESTRRPSHNFDLARSRNEIVSCRTFLLHSMSDQQSLFCLDINIEIIIE